MGYFFLKIFLVDFIKLTSHLSFKPPKYVPKKSSILQIQSIISAQRKPSAEIILPYLEFSFYELPEVGFPFVCKTSKMRFRLGGGGGGGGVSRLYLYLEVFFFKAG